MEKGVVTDTQSADSPTPADAGEAGGVPPNAGLIPGRIAGDLDYYEFVLRAANGKLHEDYTVRLTSVTAVTSLLSKGEALNYWAYDIGVEGAIELNKLVDLNDFAEKKAIKAQLKQMGYTPFVVKRKAAERGSAAHATLQALVLGSDIDLLDARVQHPTFPTEWRGYCVAVLDWWRNWWFERSRDQGAEILECEKAFASWKHGFAGTIDLLYDAFGIPTLLDLKTSKSIYDEHLIQLDGYQIALRENGYDPGLFQILLAREDGTWNIQNVDPKKVFLRLLETYRILGHDKTRKGDDDGDTET